MTATENATDRAEVGKTIAGTRTLREAVAARDALAQQMSQALHAAEMKIIQENGEADPLATEDRGRFAELVVEHLIKSENVVIDWSGETGADRSEDIGQDPRVRVRVQSRMQPDLRGTIIVLDSTTAADVEWDSGVVQTFVPLKDLEDEK